MQSGQTRTYKRVEVGGAWKGGISTPNAVLSLLCPCPTVEDRVTCLSDAQ